jgi:hypothetical protein
MRYGEASGPIGPECRLGDSHSPVGLAELACLLGFVACAYQDSYLLYPHTHTTLLRYPYTVIVVVPRSLLNHSARLHIIYVVTAIPKATRNLTLAK